jgi:transcription-repair coupling factor (superfamily II helicase)
MRICSTLCRSTATAGEGAVLFQARFPLGDGLALVPLAAAASEAELEEVLAEVRDRYGPPPESVVNLAEYGRIRMMAERIGVESIDRQGSSVVVKFRDGDGARGPDPARVVALVRRRRDVQLVPPAALRVEVGASGPLEGVSRLLRELA